MAVSNIEKAIEAIDKIDFNMSPDYIKSELADIKNILVYEKQRAIMAESKKKTNVLTAIKKILSGAEKSGRHSLATIQHSADGRPFICDGYVAIRWNNEIPELKAFEQLSSDKSIKIDGSILPNRSQVIEETITDDDKLVLDNLNKYIKLYNGKEDVVTIKLFNKYYNAVYLKRVFDVIGTDIQTIAYLKTGDMYPNFIYKDNLEAVILPLKIDCNEKPLIDSQTLKFIETLKQ